MPIFEYEPDDGECDICDGRFEVLQKPYLRDLKLKHCPTCSKPCHRVLSSFSAPRSEKDLLSASNVGSKGFTQYKRVSKGEYERVTPGPGPRILSEEMLSKIAPPKEDPS